ncbi:hypothetical protein BT69DRAFT_1358919 [Atractiella rhizophila]|nr:hypothetical protein BT69DRAFT_1358919 [Atractiella rhizophila]
MSQVPTHNWMDATITSWDNLVKSAVLHHSVIALVRDSLGCLCDEKKEDSHKRFVSFHKDDTVNWGIDVHLKPEQTAVLSFTKAVSQIYDCCFFRFVYFEAFDAHIEPPLPSLSAEFKSTTRIKAFIDGFDDEGRPLVASGTIVDNIVQDGLDLKITGRTLKLTQVHRPEILGRQENSTWRFWCRADAKPNDEKTGWQRYDDFLMKAKLYDIFSLGTEFLALFVAISAFTASTSGIPYLHQIPQAVLASIGIFSSAIAILLQPPLMRRLRTRILQAKLGEST